MLQILRTDATHPVFLGLVKELDGYLQIQNGEAHPFFAPLNALDDIKYVVLVFENNEAAGCGAMKVITPDTMEIKRMYVPSEKRGRGIGSLVLKGLEQWAHELGFNTCILETGQHMKDAVHLYTKNGYTIIPKYGPYVNVPDSVCFAKQIQ
jgi:putative acetyltransferase